jgi:hypothetical protein
MGMETEESQAQMRPRPRHRAFDKRYTRAADARGGRIDEVPQQDDVRVRGWEPRGASAKGEPGVRKSSS